MSKQKNLSDTRLELIIENIVENIVEREFSFPKELSEMEAFFILNCDIELQEQNRKMSPCMVLEIVYYFLQNV